MKGDWFAYILLVLFTLAAIIYACEGNWSKTLYFGGSAILTIGILMNS